MNKMAMSEPNDFAVELQVGKPVMIGRSNCADLVDEHFFVSKKHATVELLENGRVKLTDLESSNGTSWRSGDAPFRRLDRGAMIIIDGNADICLGGIESRYYRLAEKTLKRSVGLEIRFNNVRIVAVDSGLGHTTETVLLEDHGETIIRRGSFSVVIGTSGSGKSLLMNAVSDTLGSGYRFEGISFAPEPKAGDGRDNIRFVPQDDAVPSELTVGQVLRFAADLRLSEKTPADRNASIEDVLRQVDLIRSEDVVVSKLSGGQRKRLSVAVDLLDYPQLLILDEPTSGLDAETEFLLLKLLKKISRREGITVVCITHSNTACDLADHVLIIGKTVANEASRICFSGKPNEIHAAAQLTELRKICPSIDERTKFDAARKMGTAEPTTHFNSKAVDKPSPFGTIYRRSRAKLWADAPTFRLTFAVPIVLGILVGLSQRSHSDSLSPCFFLILSALWIGMSLTIRETIVERRIYIRDKKSGLSPIAYLFGKLAYAASVSVVQTVLLYLPACIALISWNGHINVLDGSIVASPLNESFGFHSGATVVHTTNLIVLFGTLLGGNMLGLIGSTLTATEQRAVLLQIFFLLPQILISRVAYYSSYSSHPIDWHSGPFSSLRSLFETTKSFGPPPFSESALFLEQYLHQGMDLISCIFVSRFGLSVMELTAIRKNYANDSFWMELFIEWFAFCAVLVLYFVVLLTIFKYKEKQWGLR